MDGICSPFILHIVCIGHVKGRIQDGSKPSCGQGCFFAINPEFFVVLDASSKLPVVYAAAFVLPRNTRSPSGSTPQAKNGLPVKGARIRRSSEETIQKEFIALWDQCELNYKFPCET